MLFNFIFIVDATQLTKMQRNSSPHYHRPTVHDGVSHCHYHTTPLYCPVIIQSSVSLCGLYQWLHLVLKAAVREQWQDPVFYRYYLHVTMLASITWHLCVCVWQKCQGFASCVDFVVPSVYIHKNIMKQSVNWLEQALTKFVRVELFPHVQQC